MQSPDQLLLKIGGPSFVPPSGHKLIFADTDGTVKTMDATGAKVAVSGGNSILSRAQALVPAAGFNTVFGTDFDNDRWHTTTATNGTATVSQTDKAGVLVLDSTGTGNSVIKIQPSGKPSHIDNTRTTPFYATWRIKFGTAIDAQGYIACMLLNPAGSGNPGIFFGALGNRSTANWSYEVFDNAGANVGNGVSTVALDTSTWHTVEIVNDGTNYHFLLDGTELFTLAVAAAGTNATSLQMYCGNGSTAASRTVKIDSMWLAIAGN